MYSCDPHSARFLLMSHNQSRLWADPDNNVRTHPDAWLVAGPESQYAAESLSQLLLPHPQWWVISSLWSASSWCRGSKGQMQHRIHVGKAGKETIYWVGESPFQRHSSLALHVGENSTDWKKYLTKLSILPCSVTQNKMHDSRATEKYLSSFYSNWNFQHRLASDW